MNTMWYLSESLPSFFTDIGVINQALNLINVNHDIVNKEDASDIKVTKNGYITLAYNNLFALFLENEGHFPIDFAVGYKFNL